MPRLFIIALLLAISLSAAARPPSLAGKWKLNLEQSELLPGEAKPAELIMNITVDDDRGFHWVVTVTMPGGESGSVSYNGAIDGEPRAVEGRLGSTSAFAWTPDGALKQVSQSSGGLATETCKISPDVKKMTCEARQTDSQGRTLTYSEVFDKL